MVLSKYPDLKEVLWKFSRFKDAKKRLTLKRNPRFYKRLPTLPHLYGGKFRADPIDTFQHEEISVLTDNPDGVGRVYVDIGRKRRAFGNVWIPNSAIIFRGLRISATLLSLILIYFQTSVEHSRAKVSSGRTFRTHSSYGTLRNPPYLLSRP